MSSSFTSSARVSHVAKEGRIRDRRPLCSTPHCCVDWLTTEDVLVAGEVEHRGLYHTRHKSSRDCAASLGGVLVACSYCGPVASVRTARANMAMEASGAHAQTASGLTRKLRSEDAASLPLIPRGLGGGACQQAGAVRKGVARGLALASTCLDQVDFGVPQTSSASLGGNAAKYLMRRNELKDGKKRFNSNKIHGEEAADAARASLALAAKLADRQPTLARIVTRAQHIRNEAMYQRVESRDVPTSKRIRSRGE